MSAGPSSPSSSSQQLDDEEAQLLANADAILAVQQPPIIIEAPPAEAEAPQVPQTAAVAPKPLIRINAPYLQKLSILSTQHIQGVRFENCRSLSYLKIDSTDMNDTDAVDIDTILSIATGAKQVEELWCGVNLKDEYAVQGSKAVASVVAALRQLRVFTSDLMAQEVETWKDTTLWRAKNAFVMAAAHPFCLHSPPATRNENSKGSAAEKRDESIRLPEETDSDVDSEDEEARRQRGEQVNSRRRVAGLRSIRPPLTQAQLQMRKRHAQRKAAQLKRLEDIDGSSHFLAEAIMKHKTGRIQSLYLVSSEFESPALILQREPSQGGPPITPCFVSSNRPTGWRRSYSFDALAYLNADISSLKEVHLAAREFPVLRSLILTKCFALEKVHIDLPSLTDILFRFLGTECKQFFVSHRTTSLISFKLMDAPGILRTNNVLKQLAETNTSIQTLSVSLHPLLTKRGIANGNALFDALPLIEKQLRIVNFPRLQNLKIDSIGTFQRVYINNCPQLASLQVLDRAAHYHVVAPLLTSFTTTSRGSREPIPPPIANLIIGVPDNNDDHEEPQVISADYESTLDSASSSAAVVAQSIFSQATSSGPLPKRHSPPALGLTLRSLDLQECKTDPAMLVKIAEACPNLESLAASIPDYDMDILQLVQGCPNLQVLKLQLMSSEFLPARIGRFVASYRPQMNGSWDLITYIIPPSSRAEEMYAKAERDLAEARRRREQDEADVGIQPVE